jgi:hypothetical protein
LCIYIRVVRSLFWGRGGVWGGFVKWIHVSGCMDINFFFVHNFGLLQRRCVPYSKSHSNVNNESFPVPVLPCDKFDLGRPSSL